MGLLVKKPNGNTLVWWLVGVMVTANLALAGAAWNSNNDRIERVESKVEAIQQAYSRLAVVEALSRTQDDRLERIERLLDRLIDTGR